MPLRINARFRSNLTGGWSWRTALISCLAFGVLASVAPAAGAATFFNTAPITIPSTGGANEPAPPYPSPITVSGLTGTVTGVNVTLNNYSHEFPEDTNVVLVPPGATGQNILLMSGAGGRANLASRNVTFDDASTTPLPAAAFASGTYKPTARTTTPVFPAPGPGNNFCSPGVAAAGTPSYVGGNCTLATALNGSTANGVWNLYVTDIGPGDGGTIAGGWTLDITAGGAAPTTQTLTVNNTGSGSGTGTVRGLGISCATGATPCTKTYNTASTSSVTLTAAATGLSSFAGWSGAGAGTCAGTTTPTCTVPLDAAKNVTATFNPLPRSLNLGKTGSGAGTVTGPGISCGADCDQTYPDAQLVELTAAATAGSTFAGWIGCDSPSQNTCTMNLNGNKNVTARFTLNTVYPLPPIYPPPGGGPTSLADCAPGVNVITLGDGDDVRNGTPGNDLIFAGAGNDVIDGLAGDDCLDLGPGNDRGQGGLGNDLVLGGLGNDTVNGAAGNDRLRGDAGNDRVFGDAGNDNLLGGTGSDRLFGGTGNDRMHGQAGKDTISGSSGKDRINGGAANDKISGGSSADRIAGDQGNDRINGNSSNDSLSGNSGRDRINGGSGRDRIFAGSGNDSVSARDKTRDTINCGSGRDTVVADRIDRVSRNCERVRRS